MVNFLHVMRNYLLLIPLFIVGCNSSPQCDLILKNIEENFVSGNFTRVGVLADSLKTACNGNPAAVRKADSIAEISRRIKIDFSLTPDEMLAQLESRIPSFAPGETEEWEKKGWLEGRLIDGQKMYFRRAVSNLILLKKFHEQKEEWALENSTDPELVFRLKHTAEVCKLSGNKAEPVVPVDMKITYTITVHPDVVPEGKKIRCWLPWPKDGTPRQKKIKLISTSSNEYSIAPDSAIHSSVYMEQVAKKGVPSIFSLTFTYQSSAMHFDTKKMEIKAYDKDSEVYRKFTSEQLPQICFTENIRHLADSIARDGEDPRETVSKIYCWFKNNIPWTGALEYSIMPNIPEYVYRFRRGDCGMQTFMFMSMLRYKGIPVRWESGWMVPPGKNLHDWCEVYYEGTGWVPVDVSYDLQQSDDESLKDFYLSGIDSYRLIVNEGVSGPLHPQKLYMRSEPYDFQRGEVEWEGGNLYFDKWDYNMDIKYE